MAADTINDGGSGGGSGGLSAAIAQLMQQITARPSNVNPSPSNAGMFASPRSPYNSFSDQVYDAMMYSGLMPGGPTNPLGGNVAPRYAFGQAQPMVGGGTPGATAYSGAWNPYAGRATGPVAPGGGAPGTPTPPGGGGAPGGPPAGPPANVPPRVGVPNPTQPTLPPGQPPVTMPPITRTPTPQQPTLPGGQSPIRNPGMGGAMPLQPKAAPTQPPAGMLGPQPGATPSNSGSPESAAWVNGMQMPGSGGSVGQFADYIMSLPESQRLNVFNAALQYSHTVPNAPNGLYGALDTAMRAKMGDQAFSQWIGANGGAQGIKDTAGIPAYMLQALQAGSAPDQAMAASTAGQKLQVPQGMTIDQYLKSLGY